MTKTGRLMWAIAVLLGLASSPSLAGEVRVYAFGNSLVHHLSDSEETSVPFWLGVLARAGGDGLRLEGQWGFLRDFARAGAQPNWTVPGVPGVLGAAGIAEAELDALIVTPANFIQYQPPDRPYEQLGKRLAGG